MSIWARIGEFIAAAPAATVNTIVEAVRTLFEGDPETRRRVAFSVAIIALSAKMARADGIVTQDEVRAFGDIFAVPEAEARNVSRLYHIAQQDVAGFEAYAERLARLCVGGDADDPILEDILEGLFHIAKADGLVHQRELAFLQRVAEAFRLDEARFDAMLARHTLDGRRDPYAILGVDPGTPFADVRRRYRQLAAENHPDRLVVRGVPPEFIAIANGRLAAINAAYEAIEKEQRVR